MKVSNTILTRIYVLFAVFVGFGLLVLLRVAGVQLNHDYWVQKELDEKVFFKRVVADRGNIISEKGAIMATSIPFYRIALDPTILDTTTYPFYSDSVFTLACLMTEKFDEEEERDTLKYYHKIKKAFITGDRHLYLTRNLLSYNELQEVKTWPILNLGRYKGGFVTEKIHNTRHYPYGDLARITLGRMVNDTLGIRGIEASYNHELRGRDGYILAQKIRGGSYMPLDQYGEAESDDGFDVTTTLDVDLQDILEKALKKGVVKHEARFGAAILLEVETGKIKALANYPESLNYGVAHPHEPGSTFKLFSAMASLEDSVMDVCDTLDTGDGKILFDDKEITDGAVYGKLTWEQAFAKSSNVGFSKVISEAYADDPMRYIAHLERLGLPFPANTQLKGEPTPVIHRPGDESWTVASLPSMSIGYSLTVTPLQMATAYNVIANNGIRMEPWLVKEVRNNAQVIQSYGPVAAKERACSPETVRKLKEMMLQVIEYGTARNIKGLPFRIAGKTGTARKTQGGEYVKKYVASFGGFFPVENPRYTLYVMIDEPSAGKYYGNQVAAPIFREIAEGIYKFDWQLGQPPLKPNEKLVKRPAPRIIYAENAEKVYAGLGIETSLTPEDEWIGTKDNGHQVDYKPLGLSGTRIPNMKGMSARDALNMLEKMGVIVHLSGHGKVKRQSLLPGYRVGKNTKITLYLG